MERHGEPVNLAQKEYDLLLALLAANGAVVARNTLLDTVWGQAWFGDTRTLDVHIRWLREKLEADPSRPRLILTVRGVGYRLVTPAEAQRQESHEQPHPTPAPTSPAVPSLPQRSRWPWQRSFQARIVFAYGAVFAAVWCSSRCGWVG